LPYSFLNLLHLLSHDVGLLPEYGQLIIPGYGLGGFLREGHRPLGKTGTYSATTSSHTLTSAHAATNSAATTTTLPHAPTTTTSHAATHSASHAHSSLRHH
jgi:hypothetical protein